MRSAPPARRSSTVGHPGDLVAGLADRVDGLQGRAAGGDDVLDDQAAVVGIEERALDAALQAVRLGLLADEEGLDVGAAGQGGARRGVGAHGQPADGGRPPLARAGGDQLGQGGEAGGAQDRPLGVDVVLRGWPLVRTTSPTTRAWLRNSSISRSRASMRRVPYRACWRASCGRSRSLRARSCCSASPCSRSTRRATCPDEPRRSPASRPRGRGSVAPARSARESARTRACARRSTTPTTCSSRRSRDRQQLGELVGAPRRPDAPGPHRLRLRARRSSPATPGARLTAPAAGRGGLRQQADFAIGVEEELILVDPATRALSHAGVDVLARMGEADPPPRASRTPTPTPR